MERLSTIVLVPRNMSQRCLFQFLIYSKDLNRIGLGSVGILYNLRIFAVDVEGLTGQTRWTAAGVSVFRFSGIPVADYPVIELVSLRSSRRCTSGDVRIVNIRRVVTRGLGTGHLIAFKIKAFVLINYIDAGGTGQHFAPLSVDVEPLSDPETRVFGLIPTGFVGVGGVGSRNFPRSVQAHARGGLRLRISHRRIHVIRIGDGLLIEDECRYIERT